MNQELQYFVILQRNVCFRCDGLILLETYTTMKGEEMQLPDFLDIIKEVTHDPSYSMFTLSRKTEVVDVKATHMSYCYGVVNGDINEDNCSNATPRGVTNNVIMPTSNTDDKKEKTIASIM